MADPKAWVDLTKKEKLARAKSTGRKAESVLTGPNRSRDSKKRAGAEKAKKASGNVQKRLSAPLVKPSEKKAAAGLWEMAKRAFGMYDEGKKNLKGVEKKSRGGK